MRVIQYIKEIADERKAMDAGIEQTDTPEVLLEKACFVCGVDGGRSESLQRGLRYSGNGQSERFAHLGPNAHLDSPSSPQVASSLPH